MHEGKESSLNHYIDQQTEFLRMQRYNTMVDELVVFEMMDNMQYKNGLFVIAHVLCHAITFPIIFNTNHTV